MPVRGAGIPRMHASTQNPRLRSLSEPVQAERSVCGLQTRRPINRERLPGEELHDGINADLVVAYDPIILAVAACV